MKQLVIAWYKWDKAFGAKVDLDSRRKSKDIIEKLENLVTSVWKADLDSYSIFISE